jgi:hypothetical protein
MKVAQASQTSSVSDGCEDIEQVLDVHVLRLDPLALPQTRACQVQQEPITG